MAMMGDGNTHYDHNVDGTNQELGGCTADFKNKPKPIKTRITFLSSTKSLVLEIKVNPEEGFKKCFDIKVDLPEFAYFGFSAMTGGVTANHDVISFDAWSIDDVSLDLDRIKK
jgi:hypothetical protein